MKRWAWILCGLLIFSFMENTGAQVESLQPVQLVQIHKDENGITLETDTKDFGRGDTLSGALENLQATSEKRIFLETADMLILGRNGELLIMELKTILRPAVQVCRSEDKLDLFQAAAFLQNHRSSVILAEIPDGNTELPELQLAGGRLRLAGNNG